MTAGSGSIALANPYIYFLIVPSYTEKTDMFVFCLIILLKPPLKFKATSLLKLSFASYTLRVFLIATTRDETTIYST